MQRANTFLKESQTSVVDQVARGVAFKLRNDITGVPNRTILARAGVTIGYAYLLEEGREGMFKWSSADHEDHVTLDTEQGIYVAPTTDTTGASGAWVRQFVGAASVLWFGADNTGIVDSTIAISCALDVCPKVVCPEGTYAIEQIPVLDDETLINDGIVTFAQIEGTAAATYMINVLGSNVTIGDFFFTGHIGDEDGEWNHCINISTNEAGKDLRNITVGNVHGDDIHGDVICTHALSGEVLETVRIGNVTGNNIYRNTVSITGGKDIRIQSVISENVGLFNFDIEPDTSCSSPENIWVGYIKGRNVGVVSPTSNVPIRNVRFEKLDLDPAFSARSTPPYDGPAPALLIDALVTRNARNVWVGELNAQGFDGQAWKQQWEPASGPIPDDLGTQTIHFDFANVANNSNVESTYNAHFSGATGISQLSIGHLIASTDADMSAVILTCDDALIGRADVTLATSTYYMRACVKSSTQILNQSGGGTMLNCTGCRVNGGTIDGETVFAFSAQCLLSHMGTITNSGSFDNTGVNNNVEYSTIASDYHFIWSGAIKYFVNGDGRGVFYGGVRSRHATDPIGYELLGAGGSVTQGTSKATTVVNSRAAGRIVTHNANLAANTSVTFTFTNTAIAEYDTVQVNIASGNATAGTYLIIVDGVAAGTCKVTIRNLTAGDLAEALTLNFTVTHGTIT